jgi:cytochrome c-type biogenesis protein CcsB
MGDWAQGLFTAALVITGFATLLWIITIFSHRVKRLALAAMLTGWLVLTLSIVIRSAATGHGPFSNMHEFSQAFAWGIMALGLLFWWRSKVTLIAGVTTAFALALLIFAATLSSRVISLVPALQQSTLLTLHVTAAVIAYGAFAVSFGIALVFLFRRRDSASRQPSDDVLDKLQYQAVIIGFPFLTLTVILGAIWADISWGQYWSWDPKETASLVTWLLYAIYLHARVMRGWRGKKLALLVVVGFCAVLFTFFGNYIFQGLHSYN